jgi:Flp pilus assembly pilin Flp
VDVQNFLRSEGGAGLMDYTLVIAFVAMAAVGALIFFGHRVGASATNSATTLP